MTSDRIEIIVPAYKNERLTAACFRSIRENTDPSSYRIVWMDNGCDDPSIVLKELNGLDYTHILFSSNQGFVTAVNEGLKVSKGPMVCLLNNDTIVSYAWLEKLAAILAADSKLGIVGPLTDYWRSGYGPDSHHSLTSHNAILPPEAVQWDLERINCELESRYTGRTVPISFVAFLCALIKREVIDTVGLLDTNYEMGLYDDTDYNMAARQAGFACELAIDTCIYHKGRTTFDVLAKQEGVFVGRLLKRNKAYLDNKWKGVQ